MRPGRDETQRHPLANRTGRPHAAAVGAIVAAVSLVASSATHWGCSGGGSGNAGSGPSPTSGVLDYDIVYVRYPRRGDLEIVQIPDGENPYAIEGGADLVLLRPDGSEEILVDCESDSSVQDPFVSYDGRWVYYAKYVNLDPARHWREQTGDCFLFKLDLSMPVGQRSEVQLTDGSTGLEIVKLAGNAASDESAFRARFGIRDLGPCVLGDGRIVFTSNRETIMPPTQGVAGSVNAVEASTVSQLFTLEDHDGSEPNRNLQLIGHSQIHHAQHPIVLHDGRILFTNWDDAGIRDSYGSATLYICNPDGGHLGQFLEPHNHQKRVDHFATQLGIGDVVVTNYYPFMRLWGFGVLQRYPLLSGAGPHFQVQAQVSEADFRSYSRIGVTNLTPHTSASDAAAPNLSGRYSMPAAAPDGALLVSYSSGPVASNPLSGPGTPVIDAGLYLIPDVDQRITDPSALILLKNDPAYNEFWPRPVVPYSRVHGVTRPDAVPPTSSLQPTERDRGLVSGRPTALLGTSSVMNRESTPIGRDRFNSLHGKGDPSTAFSVQGTDVGVVTDDDVYGIRVVVVTPERYHVPYTPTNLERDAGLLSDSRFSRHVKGFYSHSSESWKILGEFPVRGPDAVRGGGIGLQDPDGSLDTSFLAEVPADTPLFLQGIDRRGLTLFTEHTWRHVRPGETLASCGGCHAHSLEPIPFQGKRADGVNYMPWRIVDETPIVLDSPSGPLTQTVATGVLAFEFRRDVLPALETNCTSCHTSAASAPPPDVNGVPPKLAMFDSALTGLEYQVRAYQSLARDATGAFAHGTTIPAGQSVYHFPQASRYVRAIQARASLLTWKIYGERLDGRTNADLPVPGELAGEDVDYDAGTCPAPTLLSAAEKGVITRWIDMGCPIDLDRPKLRYTQDSLPPLATLRLFNRNGAVEVRLGAVDLESGIDFAQTEVTLRINNGPTLSLTSSDFVFDAGLGVGTSLTSMDASLVTSLQALAVTGTVRDLAGNREIVRQTVTALPPAQ